MLPSGVLVILGNRRPISPPSCLGSTLSLHRASKEEVAPSWIVYEEMDVCLPRGEESRTNRMKIRQLLLSLPSLINPAFLNITNGLHQRSPNLENQCSPGICLFDGTKCYQVASKATNATKVTNVAVAPARLYH